MGRPRPSKGPGSFFDIGKASKDVLFKDYSYDHKLTFSSTTTSGIGLETSSLIRGEGLLSDVKADFKYQNLEIELKGTTQSKLYAELAVNDPAPGVQFKLSGLLPNPKSGKAEILYDHPHAHATAAIGLASQPVVEGAVTVGQKGMAIGAEGAFDTATNQAVRYTFGASVTKDDITSSIILADKADTLKWSYVHTLSPVFGVGVEVVHKIAKNDTTFTTGASYKLDDLTTTKGRINSRGIAAFLVQHEFKPKSTATVSVEVDTKSLDKSAKYGVGIKLKN